MTLYRMMGGSNHKNLAPSRQWLKHGQFPGMTLQFIEGTTLHSIKMYVFYDFKTELENILYMPGSTHVPVGLRDGEKRTLRHPSCEVYEGIQFTVNFKSFKSFGKTPKSKLSWPVPPKKLTNIFLANHQHNEQNIKMEITKKNLAIDFFLRSMRLGKWMRKNRESFP